MSDASFDSEYVEHMCRLRALCDRISESIYIRRTITSLDIAAIEMLDREIGRAFDLYMKTVHPIGEVTQ